MPRSLLSWPRPDPGNPYLVRLTEALTREGVSVRSHPYLAALCARPGPSRWLHVHWPEWMLHDRSRARYRARTAYLSALLDAARLQGVSLAWTAHNLLGHDDPHPDLGERARRALLRRCSVVFGHFLSTERDVRAWGFEGRFALTPHPHYDGDYPRPDRDASRGALGVREGELLLASLGSLEPYKNLPAMVRAFRASDPRGVRWVIAGRPGDPRALEDLREAIGGDPRIELRARFLPRDELSAILVASDASLLGYKQFYTSGAAVLSLTLGTPVIGPPRHHLASWVGAPFFLPLESSEPGALSEALAAARSLGPEAREAARAHALGATWERVAGTITETLYGAAA